VEFPTIFIIAGYIPSYSFLCSCFSDVLKRISNDINNFQSSSCCVLGTFYVLFPWRFGDVVQRYLEDYRVDWSTDWLTS
jgi:hypothetical protein